MNRSACRQSAYLALPLLKIDLPQALVRNNDYAVLFCHLKYSRYWHARNRSQNKNSAMFRFERTMGTCTLSGFALAECINWNALDMSSLGIAKQFDGERYIRPISCLTTHHLLFWGHVARLGNVLWWDTPIEQICSRNRLWNGEQPTTK